MSTLPSKFLDHLPELTGEGKISPEPRSPKAQPRSAFARLDEVVAEARAGASDDFLARAVSVTVDAVRAWRKARNIKRVRRKKSETVDAVLAVDIDGTRTDAAMHVVDDSIAIGTWEPPQFVLRDPLAYTDFCRVMHGLREANEPGEVIAAALGFRPRDIELGIEVWQRHLDAVGRVCSRCQKIYDPAHGTKTTCRRCQ